MTEAAHFTCPICAWPELREDQRLENYNICPQCGVEFGYEPKENYENIRAEWVKAGRPNWSATYEQRDMWDRIHTGGYHYRR